MRIPKKQGVYCQPIFSFTVEFANSNPICSIRRLLRKLTARSNKKSRFCPNTRQYPKYLPGLAILPLQFNKKNRYRCSTSKCSTTPLICIQNLVLTSRI